MTMSGNFGVCHLCGATGKLSFEHVPPEAAFNDQRVLESDIHRVMSGDLIAELEKPTGKFNQRGAGKFTLCDRCNTTTGGYYGRSYVQFVKQVFPALPHGSTWDPGHVRLPNPPSRRVQADTGDVLQRVVTGIFAATSAPGSLPAKSGVARRGQSADIHVVLRSKQFEGVASVWLNQQDQRHGVSFVFRDIVPTVHPRNVSRRRCPDPALFEITWFKEFAYRETHTVRLSLNNLAVNSYFPADYRTFDGLKAQGSAS